MKRNFKVAMQELANVSSEKVMEYTQELISKDLLDLKDVAMDMNHPKAVFHTILRKLVKEFKPLNSDYDKVIHNVENHFFMKPEEVKKDATSDDKESPILQRSKQVKSGA